MSSVWGRAMGAVKPGDDDVQQIVENPRDRCLRTCLDLLPASSVPSHRMEQ